VRGALHRWADNGFFDSSSAETFNLDGDDLTVDDPDAAGGRDARSRSESFHEKFTDEGDKAVEAVQMFGPTPLHSKQMQIVTMFDSRHPQDSPEALEEQQLEALEYVSLKAWAAPGGRGRPDPTAGASATASPGRRSPWSRRRSSLSKTLVVHSGLSMPEMPRPEGANVHIDVGLLPTFEERVVVAVLGSAPAAPLDWSLVDLVMCSRRVHCEVWTVPEAHASTFLQTCDACVVDWTGDAARAASLLQLATQARDGEVAVGLRCRGKPTLAARQTAQQARVSCVDYKDGVDVVACRAVVAMAKKRGDDAAQVNALALHAKKMHSGGGACALM